MEPQLQVKTDIFEGPLDLLLQLIEKRKLLINDISLANVTDDFLERVNKAGALPMNQASHFICVASMLLLIKSRSLLPSLKLTEEEESDIEMLELRLKLYKYFKGLSAKVHAIFGVRALFQREYVPPVEPVFVPSGDISIDTLRYAADSVLEQLPKPKERKEAVVESVVSIEEMIDRLTDRITGSLNVSFNEFSGRGAGSMGRTERVTIIVSFLALLELVKKDLISVSQEGHFDDIFMETREVGIPKYGA